MTLCLIDFSPVWIGAKILAKVNYELKRYDIVTWWPIGRKEAYLLYVNCLRFTKPRRKSSNSPTQWRGPDEKVRLNDFLQGIAFIFGKKNQLGAKWNTFPVFYFIIKHFMSVQFANLLLWKSTFVVSNEIWACTSMMLHSKLFIRI